METHAGLGGIKIDPVGPDSIQDIVGRWCGVRLFIFLSMSHSRGSGPNQDRFGISAVHGRRFDQACGSC